MRILEYSELPAGSETQAQLLDLSVGWGPMDFRRTDAARKGGYPSSDYFGVYAVEDGEVLSAVRVIRIPFTTPGGVEQVAGIQGVVTRRDRGRRGLARALLKDVHAREKAAGTRFVLLWTSRGFFAHDLYESLGYRDVYAPELAALRCSSRARPKDHSLRRARVADLESMERMHTESTEGRMGFNPRPRGIAASLIKMGFIGLDRFRIIHRGRRSVGYAVMQKSPGWTRVDELVVPKAEDVAGALSLVESESAGNWLSVRNTSVRDFRETLRTRHYGESNTSYTTLMAVSLGGGGEGLKGELGAGEKSFTCQALDYF